MKFSKLCFLLIVIATIVIEAFVNSRSTYKSKLKKAKVRTRAELTELQILGSYAYLCYLAYLPTSVEEKEHLKAKSWEYVGRASYKDFGAYAYVAYNLKHHIVVIAFKGTDSIQNWMINYQWQKAEFTPGYPKGVRIHAGFHAFYLSLVEQLDNLVYKAVGHLYEEGNSQKIHKDVTFAVTGHSLGGAAATLYARYMQTIDSKHKFKDQYRKLASKYARPRVVFNEHIKLYTFGVPRIGNQVFADTVNHALSPKNIYNVIFRNDPVPRANGYDPNSYVHAGTIFICQTTDSCTKNYADAQDSISLRNVMSAFWSRNDHGADNYFKLGTTPN